MTDTKITDKAMTAIKSSGEAARGKLVSFGKKLKYAAIGFLIGVAVVFAALFFWQNAGNSIASANELTTAVVFDRIESQDELVCTSQKYCVTENLDDPGKQVCGITLPGTTKSVWMQYCGEIKAGVDMSKAQFSQDGQTIKVTLEEPYIISNTPDMNETCILVEDSGVFNRINGDDYTNLEKTCVSKSEQKVWEDDGLKEQTKENAQQNIEAMFTGAFGNEYTVEINWVAAATASESDV